MKLDLAIVIVSWNVWDRLRGTLESIARESREGHERYRRFFGPDDDRTLEVFVVDCASQDATPSLLASRFPWVRTALLKENLGFTGGNNLALQMLGLLGDSSDVSASNSPEYVLFLNPDTELTPGALYELYGTICEDPGIAAIGPRLVYADGSLQSNRRRFPRRLTGFFESTWLGRIWPSNPWVRHYHKLDWSPEVRQEVDWLVGAVLLVRSEVLRRVGGFDERFFMYSEEMDLCRRIVEAGGRIVYEPGATVIHYEGESSGQVSTRRDILFNRSKVLYYEKYFGSTWASLLRRYLLLEFRWQLLVEGLKAGLGHRRAMRKERIASYRAVIASGLQTLQRDC